MKRKPFNQASPVFICLIAALASSTARGGDGDGPLFTDRDQDSKLSRAGIEKLEVIHQIPLRVDATRPNYKSFMARIELTHPRDPHLTCTIYSRLEGVNVNVNPAVPGEPAKILAVTGQADLLRREDSTTFQLAAEKHEPKGYGKTESYSDIYTKSWDSRDRGPMEAGWRIWNLDSSGSSHYPADTETLVWAYPYPDRTGIVNHPPIDEDGRVFPELKYSESGQRLLQIRKRLDQFASSGIYVKKDRRTLRESRELRFKEGPISTISCTREFVNEEPARDSVMFGKGEILETLAPYLREVPEPNNTREVPTIEAKATKVPAEAIYDGGTTKNAGSFVRGPEAERSESTAQGAVDVL